MTETLKKFIPRAPRYVLKPVDERFLRFALHDDRQHSYSTRFLNVSETGLAFIVDRSSAPQMGDFIKLEFPIPGHEQVAWFARVMRIEQYPPPPDSEQKHLDGREQEVLVAVSLYDLPEEHRTKIRKGLNLKFNEVLRERRKNNIFQFFSYITTHFRKALLYVALTLGAFALLYLFSRF